MTRYARQIAVPAFGQQGQDRLARARVLVVGAGGLAAPVLQYLGGAGVGQIRLVDADHISRSNLHRQTLFREAEVGQPKAQTAATAIRALNPDITVTPITRTLDPANVASLCAGVDLVLDCADSFATSYILSDHCKAMGLPLISASVVGMEGHVGGFCGTAPSLRALFPDLPQRAGSCASDGVLGPVVGMIGALQAQMAVAVLAGITPSPLGQFVTFDALSLRSSSFRFDAAAEPAPEEIWRFVAATQIDARDHIIDLRAPSEGPLVHPHAQRRSLQEIAQAPPAPQSPDQRAILACRSGLRAFAAARHLAPLWGGNITLVALGDTTGGET
ncbi:ThiF family adenylyltransferase [Sagittula sp. SSi028]|uniref:ThiF family adenylyltransferase n=1 Tax=Sagittula sp. SSi028 TaxID=3400636 RepID=UPI003AF82EA4